MLVVYLIWGAILEMQMFQNHECKNFEIYQNETIMKYLQKFKNYKMKNVAKKKSKYQGRICLHLVKVYECFALTFPS